MPEHLLSRLHHFSVRGAKFSFADSRRYFAGSKPLRQNNMLFGLRLRYVAEKHRSATGGWDEWVIAALHAWPLNAESDPGSTRNAAVASEIARRNPRAVSTQQLGTVTPVSPSALAVEPLDDPADTLRKALSTVEPYPYNVKAVPAILEGTHFFPGGRGVWFADSMRENPRFPTNGVMVLGHNYYSLDGFLKVQAMGNADNSHRFRAKTWKGLQPFFRNGLNPADCFFTNFFMGLGIGDPEGRFPGADDFAYVARCQDFLRLQIMLQRPSVMLVLGSPIREFLPGVAAQFGAWRRGNSPRPFSSIDAEGIAILRGVSVRGHEEVKFTAVALVHPSRREGNVGRRRFGDHVGEAAEYEMVRMALSDSNER